MKVRSSSPTATEGSGKRRRENLEKNVSAEQRFQEADPRVQGPHGHQGGTPGSEKKKGQGKEASDSVRESRAFGFPPPVRIRSRADFLRVQTSGRKVRGRCFTLLTIQNELPASRFGITVSRKIGNAVERNRVKRKIREIQRLSRHEVLPGSDIVLVARKASLLTSFEEMQKEYLRLVRLAGLAKKGQLV